MNNIPKFLEGFNWLGDLDSWREDAPEVSRPQWSLSSFAKTSFSVRLTWYHDTQLYNIEQAAPSPHEATWLALQEFLRVQW